MSHAKAIAWTLAQRKHSPAYARQNFAVVPNVSWGLLPWEADLLFCTKSGFLSEIEIKISLSDWKADLLKAKHRVAYRQWAMVKRFYYAAPPDLARRWPEIKLETLDETRGLVTTHQMMDCAGVLAVDVHSGRIDVLKEATPRFGHRKLTDKEMLALARLGCLKAWKMAHHPPDKDMMLVPPSPGAAP